MDVNDTIEMTGNINLNSGIKALQDVNLNEEVKNTNRLKLESVNIKIASKIISSMITAKKTTSSLS